MTSVRLLWSRLRSLVSQDRLDQDFDDELATHLELLIDDARRRGLPESAARREALLKLGRPASLREQHRDARGFPLVDAIVHDSRYAIRMLWRYPAFTTVVTLTLALGIGATTAVFSLADNLLLRALPVREPHRLVEVRQTTGTIFSQAAFDHVRAHNQVFSETVGFSAADRPVVHVDGIIEPPRDVDHVSANFFRDLGVAAIQGRTPEPSDEAVAIVSYRLWRERFGGSVNILGRLVRIDADVYPVIGVAPPNFLGLSIGRSADLWISSRRDRGYKLIARLKPRVTPSHARAELQPLFDRFLRARSGQSESQIELLPAGRPLSRSRALYERPLLAMAALVTLVLLIACTNVGTLLLVRNTARRRELTVRSALGASRSRLVQQCFIESAGLAVVGGLLGLVFARWSVSIILSMLTLPALPQALEFQIDARVLGFAAGASLLGALLFGLAPAWRATQIDHTASLRSGHGNAELASTRHVGRFLLAGQVALSVLLLVGAGLFVQTLRNLGRLDVGFNPDNLLQVSLDRGYYIAGRSGGFYSVMFERMSGIPGVRSVTGTDYPLMGGLERCRLRMPGLSPDPEATYVDVGPSFVETMGISVLRGRAFSADDVTHNRRLAVISEAFARRYYPEQNAIGRPLHAVVRNKPESYEIVGVVRDARLGSLRGESGPMLYFIASIEVSTLQVRTASDGDAVARAIAQEIRRVNPRILGDIQTMRQAIDRSLEKERLVAATSAVFGLLGLLLASIGIFGVASYTVTRRTNELGIRIALGADRWSVVRESLRETMMAFCAGLAVGIIVAIAAVRVTASFISDLLFGLTATDAANLAAAIGVMVAVAVAACTLPAFRATRIDPLICIKEE